jgi:hypothetical protein
MNCCKVVCKWRTIVLHKNILVANLIAISPGATFVGPMHLHTLTFGQMGPEPDAGISSIWLRTAISSGLQDHTWQPRRCASDLRNGRACKSRPETDTGGMGVIVDVPRLGHLKKTMGLKWCQRSNATYACLLRAKTRGGDKDRF